MKKYKIDKEKFSNFIETEAIIGIPVRILIGPIRKSNYKFPNKLNC